MGRGGNKKRASKARRALRISKQGEHDPNIPKEVVREARDYLGQIRSQKKLSRGQRVAIGLTLAAATYAPLPPPKFFPDVDFRAQNTTLVETVENESTQTYQEGPTDGDIYHAARDRISPMLLMLDMEGLKEQIEKYNEAADQAPMGSYQRDDANACYIVAQKEFQIRPNSEKLSGAVDSVGFYVKKEKRDTAPTATA